MTDLLFAEAHEAGMGMSLNCALVCMGREARGLVLDRIKRGDTADDQVGVLLRSIGGRPTRLFAVVRFQFDALQLPLDIWPRPSAVPERERREGEAA